MLSNFSLESLKVQFRFQINPLCHCQVFLSGTVFFRFPIGRNKVSPLTRNNKMYNYTKQLLK